MSALKYKNRSFLVNHHLIPSSEPIKESDIEENDKEQSDDESQLEIYQDDVWVLPAFIKAGKHSYFVKSGASY